MLAASFSNGVSAALAKLKGASHTGVNLPPINYRHSPNASSRNGSKVTLVVVHDTEGNYNGAVSWLCNPNAQASAHVVLSEDGKQATQLVPYSEKAWHCADYNSQSLGLEMAGVAKHGFGSPELRSAARIVAYFLHKHGIPARHVTPDAHGNIRSGWTLHQNLGVKGGGHHDPGFNSKQTAAFASLVSNELKRGGFRPEWGMN
jgi:N-acetyl-anhydromuramyl-L-alanine amidase AmpD